MEQPNVTPELTPQSPETGTVKQDAVTAEMVEIAHAADIAGGEHGRYRRIIAAVWPLIAAAGREAQADCARCDVLTGYADVIEGALRSAAWHTASPNHGQAYERALTALTTTDCQK